MPKVFCPHCGRPIYDDDALLCLYCGASLNRDVGFLGKLKYTKPKIIIIALALMLLVSFIILMFL